MNEYERLAISDAGLHWSKVGIRHHHGINVPLFALHSQQSCGIGEFPDLLPLIKFCKEIGFDVIQLLPLNDTGPETSPYGALSAFALNPIHLGLEQLPNLQQKHREALALLHPLNDSQRIDYQKVQEGKEKFLREYYRDVGHLITATDDYKHFVEQHQWLPSYALFKAIKISHQWKAWEHWEESIRQPSPETFQQLLKQYADEISYHIFLQYLCFQQMKEVHRQALENGIFLKGDIPILINKESVDVWLNRSMFLMQFSAGSAPDMYSAEGQNWGFPLYNWPALEKMGYDWWKYRLKVAEECYSIYRLDHLVGFFRIWAIPAGHPGNEGDYYPKDQSQWIEQGTKIMHMMLKSSALFPIAEDLGNVPPPVRLKLKEMGICGTKVIRWERMWNEDKRFIPYTQYPPASMTTVSTHDSETLQLWWKNCPEEAKIFSMFCHWDYKPELDLEHHKAILFASHHTGSLFHINLLQEYLALIPGMSWPNPEDERINVPGTISAFNWSYRFKPSLEEIVSNHDLQNLLRDMIK